MRPEHVDPVIGAAIVGAQKAATTSLAEVLQRHPHICLAAGKEAHLFDQHCVQEHGPTPMDMEEFFGHRRPGQILLDATPSYLFVPGCLEALIRHSPDVRIIVVLRNPVDRALSHYFHSRRLGHERHSLIVALALERFRLHRDGDPLGKESAHRQFSYFSRGHYAAQLRRLDNLTSHVFIVDFDELISSSQRVVDDIVAFLGLEPLGPIDFPHLNSGPQHISRIHRWTASILWKIGGTGTTSSAVQNVTGI